MALGFRVYGGHAAIMPFHSGNTHTHIFIYIYIYICIHTDPLGSGVWTCFELCARVMGS